MLVASQAKHKALVSQVFRAMATPPENACGGPLAQVKSRCAISCCCCLECRRRELWLWRALLLSSRSGSLTTQSQAAAAAFSASKRRPARCRPKAVEREIPLDHPVSPSPSLSPCVHLPEKSRSIDTHTRWCVSMLRSIDTSSILYVCIDDDDDDS
jgi:hypothetical protein